jgi:uncharacterized membrane protein YiaA
MACEVYSHHCRNHDWKTSKEKIMKPQMQRPTKAFLTVSWIALFLGVIAYLVGLWNSEMLLNEKGFYFSLLMYGLFSAVSLQKSIRDRQEGLPVTALYFTACSLSLSLTILLLTIGLWNATLTSSEKGFYAMSFILALFATVTVQKNVRDVALYEAATAENDTYNHNVQE